MNLIQRLFGHRPPESAPLPFITWPGQSGQEYPYQIYSIDTTFRPLPGNYIYARQDENGNWIPVYVAQTRDMHQRLEGHEKLQEAREAGATHIHVHFSQTGQAARCSEEHDLIERWAPQCNPPVESS